MTDQGCAVVLGSNAASPVDPAAPSARVRCHLADKSVYLDGKQIATGLTTEQFQFVSAVAKADPDPISFDRIMCGQTQGMNQTHIKNAINRHVRGAMPARHLEFIIGTPRGFRLNLPPKESNT